MYNRMLSQRDNIIEVLNHLIQVSSFFLVEARNKDFKKRGKGKEQFSRGHGVDLITNFI